MTEIHGRECPLEKVFSDDFFFTIPYYQRPYDWTREEAEALLDDLLAAMGGANQAIESLDPYFLGSIVLVKGNGPDAEVVDGQQRLATLTILLAALRAKIKAREHKEGLTEFLCEKGNPIKGTPDRYRLMLRHRDNAVLEHILAEPDDQHGILHLQHVSRLTDSQRRMVENAACYLQRLSSLSDELLVRLAQYTVRRCFVVVVSAPNQESAYRVFSVLNTRGRDLSHADILKAEVIGAIPSNMQTQYTKKWEDMEEQLGREAFRDLFAHVRMIYGKSKLKGTILKEFRTCVKPTQNPQDFIDKVLLPMGNAFADLRRGAFEGNHAKDINDLVRWLNMIDNIDWVPPAIKFVSDHRQDPLLVWSFLRDLERLASGLMILRVGVNDRIRRYAGVLDAMRIPRDLFQPGSQLQLTDGERQEILRVLDGNIYDMPQIRLPVLLRLDSAISSGGARYDFGIITVEHVLPLSPPAHSEWLKWFPTQGVYERYVNRLCNLLLLSRRKNSQAQNYDFTTKKQRYFAQPGVSPFALTAQVLNVPSWTPQVLDQRQAELLNTLKQVWRL